LVGTIPILNEMAGEKIGLEVDGSNSIENVNSKTHDQEGIPPDQQRLLFVRKRLADEITLRQEPALFVALRLRGSIRIFADKIQDQEDIEDIEDIPPDKQRLLFVRKRLAGSVAQRRCCGRARPHTYAIRAPSRRRDWPREGRRHAEPAPALEQRNVAPSRATSTRLAGSARPY
jgi:ubiquitin